MRYRTGISLVLLVVGIVGGTSAAEPETNLPPSSPEFLKAGNPTGFIAPAKAYLNKQPPGEEALRVAGDLLMVAILVKNEDAIGTIKLRLIAEYPGSVTGQYLLSE